MSTENDDYKNENVNKGLNDIDSMDNDSKDMKDKETIPNSLIIYLKTRIPNLYKLNYEPYMTVPNSKSHTVYLDPIVKYYENAVKNIPSSAPKDAIYTQFFEAPEFDTMINRILSDFRYMQKPKTFKEAYDEHIIENNIRITLNTLFKRNNNIYMNKIPYTIVGVNYNPQDWQLSQKPLDKLLNQFSHLSPNQLQDEATQEVNNIPEIMRQGNASSANLTSQEKLSIITDRLQNNIDKDIVETDVLGTTESFIPQENLPGVSNDMIKLYSEYLRQNVPINYSNIQDIMRDPITLSLLINQTELLNFINTNKKSNIIELYSAYIDSKVNIQNADKSYVDTFTNLAVFKTEFEKKIKNIKDDIYRNKNTNNMDSNAKTALIQEITQLKINYITYIFNIADNIIQIYDLQQQYFITTRALLIGLKEDYVNIIKYYEKPELALKCIDNDIYTLELFIYEDSQNPYSASYFNNMNTFKNFYKNQLYKNKEQLLNPNINYQEETNKYFGEPNILNIELQQYELYTFKMSLFYSYNQFDIWTVLFKTTEQFVKFIGDETIAIINNADIWMDNLYQSFDDVYQKDFFNRHRVEGVKATYDSTKKKVIWHLVDEDGNNILEKKKKPSFKEIQDEIFEQIYIKYMKTNVKAYDAVMLYIYLLEIMCMRQNRIYIAEENVNQLNLEFSLTLNFYYEDIIKSINNLEINNINESVFIPSSVLWDSSSLNQREIVEKRIKINDKSNIIYRSRLKYISEARGQLVSSCESIKNIIMPNVSKRGFVEQCNNIVKQNSTGIMKHSFNSSYWIDKTIEKYDIKSTNDIIYNINRIVKDAWYDKIINKIDVKYFLNWIVLKNEYSNVESLYASVCDGLNRQLDISNSDTTNPYTEMVDNKRIFTPDTIKQMVKDVSNQEILDKEEAINVLQNTLKIKFIIFEMYTIDKSEQISFGDFVVYKNDVSKVNIKPILYRVINKNDDETLNLYDGYSIHRNVAIDEIKIYDNNILSDIRIMCNKDATSDYKDCMYLLVTKDDENESDKYHFKLLYNTNSSYVLSIEAIPIYLKYFIYNSCGSNFGYFNLDFDKFSDERNNVLIKNNDIEKDIEEIENNIKKYKEDYERLKELKKNTPGGLSLEQQAEQLLLKEEIKDLKDRIKLLRKIMKNENKYDKKKIGGAVGDIYHQNIYDQNAYEQNLNAQQIPNQYNPLGYPMNPNMPTNIIYIQQPGIRYENMMKPYNYNVEQNKKKDQQSKLAFYITVELELYPGKTANLLQQSAVKCQSTFERIREAWSDIFGYQYRPAPMSEAYTYNMKLNEEKKNAEEKKNVEIKKNNDSNNVNIKTEKIKKGGNKTKTVKNRC